MDLLRYDVVDVFTTAGGAYTGNPLAVVHGGHVLTTGQMQTIAAEFGLSETGALPAEGQTGVAVAQGAEMGRPSELGLLVVTSGGAVQRTSVYGSVSRVARGELVALP